MSRTFPINLLSAFLSQDPLSGPCQALNKLLFSHHYGFQLADGRGQNLAKTLGSLRAKPISPPWEMSAASFSRGFPCSRGRVSQEMNLEFKGRPRGVRALNPHFRPVLPIRHPQRLVQVAGTSEICLVVPKARPRTLPVERGLGRGWEGWAGMNFDLVPGLQAKKLLSWLAYLPVDPRSSAWSCLRKVLFCVLWLPLGLGCHSA